MVALNFAVESIVKYSNGRLFQSMIVLGQKLYLYVSGRMVASEQQTTGNASAVRRLAGWLK